MREKIGNPAIPHFANRLPCAALSHHLAKGIFGSFAYHQSGRYDGDGWSVNVVDDSPGNFMNYGPYSTSVSAEAHTAVFRLQVDNVDADNYNILYIDVYDATTDTVVASKSIYRNEFRVPSKYQNFKLAFTPSAPYHSFEFRTYWFGGSYVKQDKVAVF